MKHKDFFKMSDSLFLPEGRKESRAAPGRRKIKQKVRQAEYAELEKTQTSQQEKLETLKQAIAGAPGRSWPGGRNTESAGRTAE